MTNELFRDKLPLIVSIIDSAEKLLFVVKVFVFCVAFFLTGDWFMQRGQTPMFAHEIIYSPYFYLQKRSHVGYVYVSV